MSQRGAWLFVIPSRLRDSARSLYLPEAQPLGSPCKVGVEFSGSCVSLDGRGFKFLDGFITGQYPQWTGLTYSL